MSLPFQFGMAADCPSASSGGTVGCEHSSDALGDVIGDGWQMEQHEMEPPQVMRIRIPLRGLRFPEFKRLHSGFRKAPAEGPQQFGGGFPIMGSSNPVLCLLGYEDVSPGAFRCSLYPGCRGLTAEFLNSGGVIEEGIYVPEVIRLQRGEVCGVIGEYLGFGSAVAQ
ncbi:hypothetical protein EEZ25_32185 [Micromonospora aurantiaca]|nr:hypothetical protein EEZ25_32185 [Micromonospora aurantiaca]